MSRPTKAIKRSTKAIRRNRRKTGMAVSKLFMLNANARSWVIKSEVNIHKRGPLYVMNSVPNFSISGHLFPELNV